MILFIIGVVILIVAIVAFGWISCLPKTNKYGQAVSYTKEKFAGVVAAILAVVLMVISCFATIPTGYTGIMTTFGKVNNRTLEAGLNFKAPWQKIVKMDNREQKVTFDFPAFSSDIQQVQVLGSFTFSINQNTAMNLYREVGTKYVDILVNPRVVENVKTVFSRYNAEELISSREVLSDEILNLLVEDLKDKGVNILSIAIEDIDFTDAFTNAIEEKQVATQNKLKAETEQAQKILEAEAEAERKKIEADAAAEIRKIEADAIAYETITKAEAEAEANYKIAESLTPEIIEKMYYDIWNGELPTYMGGDSTTMIQIPDIE